MSIYRVGLHFDTSHGTTDIYKRVKAENALHAAAIAAALWVLQTDPEDDDLGTLDNVTAEWERYV